MRYTRITVERETLDTRNGLPCSLLLRMMAPLNLVELNHLSPHDTVMLTQKLYYMLWIRQVGIERRDIINDNVSRWL
jgi:hypothetical protein